MNNRRRRVTYRPGKAQALFGGVVGILFIGIGLFVAVPTFGPFGILWTLMAVGITAFNFYTAFGKNYAGPEIHIEEDNGSEPEDAPAEHHAARLERLRSLYDQRLITQEEYEEKRKEIVKEL